MFPRPDSVGEAGGLVIAVLANTPDIQATLGTSPCKDCAEAVKSGYLGCLQQSPAGLANHVTFIRDKDKAVNN